VRFLSPCHNCSVVRRLVTAGVGLALSGALAGCSPAAPVDLGIDYDDVSAPGSGGSDTELASGSQGEGDGYDPSLVESNGGSAICGETFAACGGSLSGTWVVEDTCGPETRNRKALQMWGQNLMKLDASACGDAARRLISRWSGQLAFEDGIAIDQRTRMRTLDVDLKQTCLSASVGVLDSDRLNSAVACEALQDDSTSCALVGGVCRCSSRLIDAGKASGVYGVLAGQVAVALGAGSEIYDYCVDKGRLIWHERGSATPVVLRKVEEGTSPDPVGFPR
jgi:hypothetical protein